jgi:hypothetical protein
VLYKKRLLIGETPTIASPSETAKEGSDHIHVLEIGTAVAPSHKRILIAVLVFAILGVAVAPCGGSLIGPKPKLPTDSTKTETRSSPPSPPRAPATLSRSRSAVKCRAI